MIVAHLFSKWSWVIVAHEKSELVHLCSAGAVPIKTKLSTAAVGKAEAEIQAKQANVKDLKNIDIDSQHLNYEISSIPRESW